MASVSPPRDRSGFEVAILCALTLESECVQYVFDKVWGSKRYGRAPGDDNAYTLGVIAEHNIVLVHLPSMGTDRAASAVTSLRSSFTNINLVLIVGICGGMPGGSTGEEIVLGDVVISEALVRYDFGRQYPQGFERKTDVHDILGPPSEKVLALLAKLKTRQHKQVVESKTSTFLQAIQQKAPDSSYPGVENDILYRSSHTHRHRLPSRCASCKTKTEICKRAVQTTCEDLGCGHVMLVSRSRLNDSSTIQPKIHFGVMGSGNTVIKSGHHRDALAKQEGIIAVEMEGAGVWRYGPTVVIKGVCDYADSHKRKGWQRYAAATAAACTKAFLTEWSADQRPNISGHSAGNNEHFLVPPRRVKKFFGREDELAKIASYFDDESDQPRMLALHAMGGQGKSQIALKYCYNFRHTYKGVFWVNGSSTGATIQSLASIAQAIDKVTADRLIDNDSKAVFALRTLEQWEDRWLMVFDNCDDAATFPKLQQSFLPQDVLLTSRHRDLEELCDLIEVPPMPESDGIELLLHRHRGVIIKEHLAEASQIVNRLGGLALAIDQASAYIQHTRLPLEKLNTFLSGYLAQRTKILQHVTRHFWQYTTMAGSEEREIAISAFTTWEMSFQQLLHTERDQDSISHFLTLSAFLGLTHVNETLFRWYWEESDVPPSWMAMFTVPESEQNTDQHRLNGSEQAISTKGDVTSNLSQAVEQLDLSKSRDSWSSDEYWDLLHRTFQLSLLRSVAPAVAPEGASFILHPLIRDWLQLRLAPRERQSYTREAIEVVARSLQSHWSQHFDPHTRSTMMLHINAVLALDKEFFHDGHRLGQELDTCNNAYLIATSQQAQGFYDVSIGIFRTIVATATKHRGADDVYTLASMSNLALALSHGGKYTESEAISRGVAETYDRLMGREHPNTLTSLNNLALALYHQSKYTEAEETLRGVVELRERVLGKEHSDTLMSLDSYATVLHKQEKHTEAEEIHRRVVETEERTLGKEHPDTLMHWGNLALTVCNQGKYTESEEMHLQVLEIMERVLGKEHPNTLLILNNLAFTLSGQRKYDDAQAYQQRALETSLTTLGPDHPNTLLFCNNLSQLWSFQGYSEPEIQTGMRHLVEMAMLPSARRGG